MADSTTHVLDQYHRSRFHVHLHKPAPDTKVIEVPATAFSLKTTALDTHGTSVKWEHIKVAPLTDGDEIHVVLSTPHDMDTKFPFYVRWGLISNAAAKAVLLETTYDTVDTGATHAGSDDAGDGGTAFTETIATVTTTANPGADKPFFTVWGKANGTATDFDILHVKAIVTDATTAAAVRAWSMQFAYRPLTA